jgi:hypothetical protein
MTIVSFSETIYNRCVFLVKKTSKDSIHSCVYLLLLLLVSPVMLSYYRVQQMQSLRSMCAMCDSVCCCL